VPDIEGLLLGPLLGAGGLDGLDGLDRHGWQLSGAQAEGVVSGEGGELDALPDPRVLDGNPLWTDPVLELAPVVVGDGTGRAGGVFSASSRES
jgi:hypothetical protein